jgi:selenocysteine lyase/cysteine desulfurase
MPLARRDFLLIGSGLLAQAACAGSAAERETVEAAARQPAAGAPRVGGFASWQAVRDLFDLDWSYLHMAGLLLTSHPTPVREAIAHHRRMLDRNPAVYIHQEWQKLDQVARRAAAAFLGADSGEVAMTDSTTMGLGLLYGGFRLRPGQEIVTTEHDHYVTHQALRFRSLRDGAPLRKVALFAVSAKATEEEIVGRLARAISPRTRLVAITWVHSSTGVKLPLRAIADRIAEANRGRDEADRVLLAVDGVHGFGIEDFRVDELGCDFFVAGCHKWLFGPRGTGLLWGRQREWKNVQPTIPPFEKEAFAPWIEERSEEPGQGGIHMTPGGFHSFEHRWALSAAFDLHQQIGRKRIEERIHALNGQLKEGLAKMRHVTLHTPGDRALSAGLVCFEVAGMKPDEVVEHLLAKRIVASATPYRTSYARLTPGLLNTPEEVETALRAVGELARAR